MIELLRKIQFIVDKMLPLGFLHALFHFNKFRNADLQLLFFHIVLKKIYVKQYATMIKFKNSLRLSVCGN